MVKTGGVMILKNNGLQWGHVAEKSQPTLLLTIGEASKLLDLNRTPRPGLFCKRWRTRVFWRSHPMAALAGRRTAAE